LLIGAATTTRPIDVSWCLLVTMIALIDDAAFFVVDHHLIGYLLQLLGVPGESVGDGT
jgi:hypothetical protein